MTKNNDTIQEKINTLHQLIEWFNGDDFSLEESVEKFRAAETLAREIEEELKVLKNEIETVKKSFDK